MKASNEKARKATLRELPRKVKKPRMRIRIPELLLGLLKTGEVFMANRTVQGGRRQPLKVSRC